MKRRGLLPAGALAVGLIFASQGAAEAQNTLNLSSSVVAQCVGGIYGLNTCEAVRFTLSFDSPQNGVPYADPTTTVPVEDIRVSQFQLYGLSPAWAFYVSSDPADPSLLAAAPGNWSTSVQTGAFRTENTSTFPFPLQPITFDIRMASYAADGWIDNFSAEYDAFGRAQVVGSTTTLSYSTNGPVSTVPEPISMILMGTGLLGVGGVARRRRRALEA